MKWMGMAAASMATFTAGLHLVGGGMDVVTPFLKVPMPQELQLILYACWHLVSVMLLASAWVLWSGLRHPADPQRRGRVQVVLAWWAAGTLVFWVIALRQAGWAGLWLMPQWILFLPVLLLGYGWLQGTRHQVLKSAPSGLAA
ncbi:hypothetical protein [Leeia aquatica]|uniref:Uncharacterized protein n=1 Tax=Leeia aquatica TaxID=2725557 RepID=A0A847S4M6_9NEIS|nr:hypothetical protein [Leeia aquatica]NLR74744.1 hypothetical protein [Leeia aquatica]